MRLVEKDIESPYPVSDAQVKEFTRDGFIRLRNVFSPETISHYGPRITALTIERNTQARPLAERSTYDRAFLQVMNLWEHSDIVREFVLGQRLGRIAATLLQVAGVRLYHDQSLYKEPGGGFTPAHADQYYWPLSSDRTVTAWIPLQAVPRELGPLAFYAGSHRVGFGRDLEIGDESERVITANLEAHGFPIVDEPFELGEVSFHLGWTFHKAGPNRSQQPRSVMTIIYMDRDMRLIEPTNEAQRRDREQWCPGAVVGERIATPKNPEIYPRG